MSKVLVLGMSPLPIENEIVLNGPGIRTWQFVKPLIDDGQQVCLICLQSPGAYKQKNKEFIEKKNNGNFTYYSLPQEEFERLPYIQKIYDDFQPDCIFSISSFLPSYAAVRLNSEKPMWFDRGDLMSEAQIKASVENNDDYLYYFWKLEELVLEKGDIFSAVSSPQRFALIGRLGGAGRLNRYTTGYEFVWVVPCGIENGDYTHTNNIIRGKYVNEDDFVILWSGGYNTWTAVDVLFSALEKAMDKNKKIKFVSTGGTIIGQNEITYSRFLKLINTSKYKERYIMLGWVSTEDLPNIYLESNLGINIDKYCYEVVLGSRHRLLDWMRAVLPILTTSPSELTQILDEKKMVFTFPFNDVESFAKKMLDLSSKKELLVEYAQRAKCFVQEELSYGVTTRSFREWVKDPRRAPDKGVKSKEKEYIDSLGGKFLHKIEAEYIDSLKNQINNLIDGQCNLKSHISNLESERENLKTHIFNIENEQCNLKSHISNLEAERGTLKALISNIDHERNALIDRLNKINSTVAYKTYSFVKKYIFHVRK